MKRRTVAPPGLVERYGPQHLAVFTPEELDRFLGREDRRPDPLEAVRVLAWQLLYRVEPDLYDRLIAGEEIHPSIWDVFPSHVHRAVEVAAGTGRLTLRLAGRCDELVAVEPAAPMRDVLGTRVREAGLADRVRLETGFFEDLPLPDRWADLVCSCSAFTPEPGHGGEQGLAEMERVCARGGLVVLVWPTDPEWLVERGFEYRSFPGEMSVRFSSASEAVEIARVFYPSAARAVEELGSHEIPYEILGTNAPRDVAWRRVG